MPLIVASCRFHAAGRLAVLLALGLAGAAMATQPPPPSQTDTASTPATPAPALSEPAGDFKKQWGLIENYCFKCHNTDDWAGEIAFDTMSLGELPENADVWEKAVRKLRGRLMPPPGKPQPDNAAVASLVSYLETSLDKAHSGSTAVGREGLHRLNRREYANAVSDLLELQIDPATLLPRDEAHDGFDNIATALEVSPSFMDQYLAAAHKVAAEAMGNAAARPVATTYTVQGAGTQQYHRDGLPFGTRGGTVVEHYFPADGEYQLTIADMASALWVHDMEFENTVVAMLDGEEFFRTTIGGEADLKAIDQLQDPAVDSINKRLKGIRFKASAGLHKVGVTFLARTFAESDSRLFDVAPGGGQDKIKRLTSFEVRGPFDAKGVAETASRKRIFSCYPKSAAEEDPCAAQIISALADRAFRGEVDATSRKQLFALYTSGRKNGGFETGIRFALAGILASPSFLYRANLGAPGSGDGPRVLTDLELASRLSFFLWSSIPDKELLDVARGGHLRDHAVLEAQVQRMLSSPKSIALVNNFAFEWLNVARLDEIAPDPRLFPYASGFSDIREPFRQELRLFIDDIFRNNASVLDLLSSDRTFVNERLALHYGIDNVRGDQFRPITLTESARRGLLGKGAVLMLTSYPNRTAPVLRGAWILERITGTPPGTPPPNVGNLKEEAPGKMPRTIREQMNEHSKRSNCFACHGIMDPLGFALENFDAVGQYRKVDRTTRVGIDSSGKLPDGTVLKGPDDLRKALLAKPEQFVQTLTEKLMEYGLGRPLDFTDEPTARAISRSAAKDNYRFASMISAIVETDQFQKTAPAPATPAHAKPLQAANHQ
jgi:mono/diheme cytochrome c family protein